MGVVIFITLSSSILILLTLEFSFVMMTDYYGKEYADRYEKLIQGGILKMARSGDGSNQIRKLYRTVDRRELGLVNTRCRLWEWQ